MSSYVSLLSSGTGEVSTDEDSSGSRSSSRTDSRSTHFSQRDNPTVVRDSRQAAMVDLSSVRKKYKGEWIVCLGRGVRRWT
jgi:hypothetical protein